jgi:hypothetical protein
MKSMINPVFVVFLCFGTSCSDSHESDLSEAAKATDKQSTTGGSITDQGTRTGYWTHVDPVWEKISIYDGPERFLLEFGKAPKKSQTLFAAHWAQSEIMNGGLGQFFSNSTGVLAPEAVEAFREIGMPRCASILSDAMRFFGEEYPRDRKKREQVFEQYFAENGENAVLVLEQEDAMEAAINEENGGFRMAADNYAAQE